MKTQISQIRKIDADIDKYKGDPQTFAIIGAAMEVHRELGLGFLEAVYQEALVVEFEEQQIPFSREVPLPVTYKWATLPCSYRADFVCYEEIILEIKAINSLTIIEQSQVLNYMKATGFSRGLLLNFGAPTLQIKRFINSK